ncbi:MAG: hypothetical protein JST13_03395, partial [Bacteroidetes bacterium]|nr:hypothetical protein [Bacteroidota bacterium]
MGRIYLKNKKRYLAGASNLISTFVASMPVPDHLSRNKATCLLLAGIFFISSPQLSIAQTSYPFKVARDRMLFHDDVDKEQARFLKMASKSILIKDENVRLEMNNALIRKIDELQERIEEDTILNSNNKKRYLRGLEFLVRGFNNNVNKTDFPPTIAPGLVAAFEKAMMLDRRDESIEPVIGENNYGIGEILVDCFLLPYENKGIKASRYDLFRKYCGLHPSEIFTKLQYNLDVPFADSLIIAAGHRNMRQLYDFAAARNALGQRIRESRDTLVHVIGQMALSKSGQLYFPFLDNLLKGKITIEEIDKVKEDGINYYKLLVKTRLDYANRVLPPARDTALEMAALTQMLTNKAREVFVNEINGLHDKPDAIRFKVLEPLTAEELYYLIVLSEDVIYTSSYVRGVYPMIFERMKAPRGDSLIMQVHGDYFRKFIKMAAGYNTLDNFLGTMDKENANTVMKAFAIGLEKATEEDAVDVADSYSSIFEKNKPLARFVLNEVKWNYRRNLAGNNKKGIIIYNLLQTLFESADTANKINLSERLGIPPIYSVNYNELKDSLGRVVEQAFFYGGDEDKDGQLSFGDFMSLFRGKPQWKITENPQWASITSTSGKPVYIFANKPLDGDDDPDEKAADALTEYLESKHMAPTIYIHRGHSYHVSSTLKRLRPSAKIVVLGSCGGYNNLSEVLRISHDAHIISSKQVGTRTVNEPILQAINNTLASGKNIEWLNMWKELGYKFRNDAVAKDRFDD